MHNSPRAYEMVSRNVVPVFTAWAGFVLCLCAEMTITTDIYIYIFVVIAILSTPQRNKINYGMRSYHFLCPKGSITF